MLYIERDNTGAICALHKTQKGNLEPANLHDKEIIAFLQHAENSSINSALEESDTNLVRVMEDLIDLLVRKNIIHFTDLPEIAQKKIAARQNIRKQLSDNNFMVDEII